MKNSTNVCINLKKILAVRIVGLENFDPSKSINIHSLATIPPGIGTASEKRNPKSICGRNAVEILGKHNKRQKLAVIWATSESSKVNTNLDL